MRNAYGRYIKYFEYPNTNSMRLAFQHQLLAKHELSPQTLSCSPHAHGPNSPQLWDQEQSQRLLLAQCMSL